MSLFPVKRRRKHLNDGNGMQGTSATEERLPLHHNNGGPSMRGSKSHFLMGGIDKRKRIRKRPHKRRTYNSSQRWFLLFLVSCFLYVVFVGFRLPRFFYLWRRKAKLEDLQVDHSLKLPSLRDDAKRLDWIFRQRFHLRDTKKQHNQRVTKVLDTLARQFHHRNDPIDDSSGSASSDAAASGDGDNNLHTTPRTTNKPTKTLTAKPTPAPHTITTNTRLPRTLKTMGMYTTESQCPEQQLDDLSVTLVVQSSVDRLWILHETCRRWKDPIVVVVAEHKNEQLDGSLVSSLQSECPQLQIVRHVLEHKQQAPEDYPVNYLRNLALDAVTTSHVLTVDVDFVPSQDLDQTIRRILPKAQDTDALVVPAFERVLTKPCADAAECRQHLETNHTFIPHTFADLHDCQASQDCRVFQNNVNRDGHSSTRSAQWLERDWFENGHDTPILRLISCFDSLRYEPYVVVRWCPASGPQPVAPYYDERFHGYGKNKIQHISHLRFLGYSFRVLPEGFIVHHPHPESVVKERWNNVHKFDLHQSMDRLYRTFLQELVELYLDTNESKIVKQCSDGSQSA